MIQTLSLVTSSLIGKINGDIAKDIIIQLSSQVHQYKDMIKRKKKANCPFLNDVILLVIQRLL